MLSFIFFNIDKTATKNKNTKKKKKNRKKLTTINAGHSASYTINLSPEQEATIYEALLAATYRMRGAAITLDVVRQIMRIIDNQGMPYIACGSPVVTKGLIFTVYCINKELCIFVV